MKTFLSWFFVVIVTFTVTGVVGYVAYYHYNDHFEIITLLAWAASLGIAKQAAYSGGQ